MLKHKQTRDRSRKQIVLLIIVRRLLRILRLLMELLRGRLRVRRLLRVRLRLTGRRASIVTILLRTTRIATVLRGTSTTTVTLLRQQNSANSFVDWFQGRQVGGRNLDWVASHGQHNNVLPGVEFVLVLDHLRPLPIILDTGSLQRKLFHFNRHGATGLCLNHSNIILGLSSWEEREREERKKKVSQNKMKSELSHKFPNGRYSPWIGTCSSSTAAQ